MRKTEPAGAGRARTHTSHTNAEPSRPVSGEDRALLWLLLLLHLALEAALILAAITLYKFWSRIQLDPWQKVAFEVGIGLAFVVFGVRAVGLLRRIRNGTRLPR